TAVVPLLFAHAQRVQQPGPVMGIVRVSAHPPVGGPPKTRQGREGGRRAAVHQQVSFTDERGGHRAFVHPHHGDRAVVARGRQLGRGERAHPDRGAGECAYGQDRGKHLPRAPVGDLRGEVRRSPDRLPRVSGRRVAFFLHDTILHPSG